MIRKSTGKKSTDGNSRKLRAGLAAACCLLTGGLMIAGASAYLTDTAEVTNNFTVGEVTVALKEPDYPGNNSPQVLNQTPGQETPKNPLVENTGKNDAVVFMQVRVPMRELTPIQNGKAAGSKKASEVFTMKLNGDSLQPGSSHFRDSWVLLGKGAVPAADGKSTSYLFGYSRRVKKGEKTDALFDKVQMVNFREEEISTEDPLSINISTFAIQADSILDGETPLSTDGVIGKDTLEKIYEIYALQNDQT
ncbi:MAG: hypothetical protein IJV26_03910 [Lachnospiraceae bacterium]|nr:hypothetical protein [Lachnospiraceae bacterium]